MKKRILPLLLCGALVLSGCGLLRREYTRTEPHSATYYEGDRRDVLRAEGRQDLVNDLLLYLSNLRSIFVPINKHGAQGKKNAELIEKAYASDNQIITFPAGLCSRKQNGKIQDTEWKKSFIQKAVEYRRDIVPVFFEGRNSNFFYRLANMRKALGIKMNYEMIYLPDEMFKSKHKTYSIHFGKPIPWQTFDSSRKPAEWAEWVKEIVYNLKK